MAKANKIKIIIDTNWYISASINKKSRRKLFRIITDKRFSVYYNDTLLNEYFLVIERESLKKYIKISQAKRFVGLVICKLNKNNKNEEAIFLSRDLKDDFLLELSKAVGADYLITGDDDLLVLSNFESTKILTMTQFIELFKVES